MQASSKSAQLYQRALKVLPGGVSRNAVLRKPHPSYLAHAEGCHITDIEGVRRLDFANNMCSLIHGHSHPKIIEAVTRQLQHGTASTLATEVEVEYAEHLVSRSESFEKIRFVNSGTEAIICCLKAARAFTNRPKIAKVEGAYHGLYDYAEVSQTASPSNWGSQQQPARVPVTFGTPASALEEVIVLPFNNLSQSLALLEQHANDIACVLVDPLPHRVGFSPASAEFVEGLHRWTRANGSLAVFDEVITFRSEYGGAQQWYRVRPDLTALGKMIGGGFPVGAITGRAEVMDVLNPLAKTVLFPHSGTFSANPITLRAGLTAMQMFDRDAVTRLNALGEYARGIIRKVIEEAEVPACVTGAGSAFRIHFKPTPPADYRESYPAAHEVAAKESLLTHLFNNGIMMINTLSGTLSTPMSQRDIDRLADELLVGFKLVRPLLLSETVC